MAPESEAPGSPFHRPASTAKATTISNGVIAADRCGAVNNVGLFGAIGTTGPWSANLNLADFLDQGETRMPGPGLASSSAWLAGQNAGTISNVKRQQQQGRLVGKPRWRDCGRGLVGQNGQCFGPEQSADRRIDQPIRAQTGMNRDGW